MERNEKGPCSLASHIGCWREEQKGAPRVTVMGDKQERFFNLCRSFFNPCHSFFNPCRSFFNPCHSFFNPCRSFFNPCRSFFNPCRSFFNPCRSFFNPCHSFFDPCRSFFNPCPHTPATPTLGLAVRRVEPTHWVQGKEETPRSSKCPHRARSVLAGCSQASRIVDGRDVAGEGAVTVSLQPSGHGSCSGEWENARGEALAVSSEQQDTCSWSPGTGRILPQRSLLAAVGGGVCVGGWGAAPGRLPSLGSAVTAEGTPPLSRLRLYESGC
ncbi:uncharacterized protein LOC129149545 [Eptesicus fuscus]|uniref:uncharacterized protein LOC129149545 n=1 Tax=Eptesicus fuscus TaxID=29078 RepID=UPI0024045BFB|nr:uncharacterized protein LOC129149545 [Eptesicus fuscus]